MKTVLSICLFALLGLTTGLYAASQPDIEQHASCEYCGMDRNKFAHSRMLIEYTDDSVAATCSLHCAALEFALRIDKTPRNIQVADFNSQQLLAAEQASWVLGGAKPGVMSSRGKWAFADKVAAAKFVQQQGGIFVGFDQAMKAAYEDMYEDTQMIRKKRQSKKKQLQQMGH